jgi:hypothetical protein
MRPSPVSIALAVWAREVRRSVTAIGAWLERKPLVRAPKALVISMVFLRTSSPCRIN